MKLVDRLFPRRFVTHSLATHLSGVFAMEPGPLRLAVEEARVRLAATPTATIRELASRRPEERGTILVLEAAHAMRRSSDREALDEGDLEELGGDEEDAAEDAPTPGMVARIPIMGTIVRGDASCARFLGLDATGLDEIRYGLEAALADPNVSEILLEVCSPGGVATGVAEVADMIAAGTATKPIRAHVSGLAASAAYWLISQCTEITAERSALIGSIGCYAVIEDTSKAFEAEGVQVHVVRSGPHKGSFVDGTPVTDEQLRAEQVVVDDIAALFTASIAEGRGLSPEDAHALATGEVWIAAKAIERGLVDRTTSFEASGDAGTKDAREGGDTTAAAEAGAVQEDEVDKKEFSALAERLTALETREQQSNVELEKLRAENEQLKAAEAARAASLAAVTASRKTAVIDRGVAEGRIVATMRASVEAYAATVGDDVAKLESFVASLPVQIHGAPVGVTPNAVVQGPGAALTDEDRRVAAMLGVPAATMVAANSGSAISIDGKAIIQQDASGKRTRLAVVTEGVA
jgi:signal peptide peptidase SppA